MGFGTICILVVVSQVAMVMSFEVSPTPQMGWNSWNKFACNISESLIKETADSLVSSGLSALGYNYVNLDDCWQSNSRDSEGRIQPDPVRFPSGMKSLGDYIHSKGLKFGIYSSAGFQTCQAFPASLGLEEIDAASYAEWGVDYLKYDNCYNDHGTPQNRFTPMAEALAATGRPIFFSLCEWGRENPAAWAASIGGNSWRVSLDIRDDWRSIITRAAITASLWRYAGPSLGWNDPDMLEVGNGHCSDDEYVTHFSLWAMLKAPLIIGNDIRGLNVDDQSNAMLVLSNQEVIAVNQDALGRQARIVWSDFAEKLAPTGYGDRLIATKCASGVAGAYEDAVADQKWTVQSDGTIKSEATGQCLNEIVKDLGLEEFALFNFSSRGVHPVSTADCATATRWVVGQFVGGAVQSRATGKCLEVATMEFSAEIQGKRIQTAPCQSIDRAPEKEFLDVRQQQSWTAPHGVLRNLYQRSCLTVDRDAFSGVAQEIWVSPLSDGVAVLFVNKGPIEAKMTLTGAMVGLNSSDETVFRARDLWAHEDLRSVLSSKKDVSVLVKPHGVVMLKLVAEE